MTPDKLAELERLELEWTTPAPGGPLTDAQVSTLLSLERRRMSLLDSVAPDLIAAARAVERVRELCDMKETERNWNGSKRVAQNISVAAIRSALDGGPRYRALESPAAKDGE